MARRAACRDESGPSVVGQTFSLQTGFSRSPAKTAGLKPRAG
jgi:hypothetical protein